MCTSSLWRSVETWSPGTGTCRLLQSCQPLELPSKSMRMLCCNGAVLVRAVQYIKISICCPARHRQAATASLQPNHRKSAQGFWKALAAQQALPHATHVTLPAVVLEGWVECTACPECTICLKCSCSLIQSIYVEVRHCNASVPVCRQRTKDNLKATTCLRDVINWTPAGTLKAAGICMSGTCVSLAACLAVPCRAQRCPGPLPPVGTQPAAARPALCEAALPPAPGRQEQHHLQQQLRGHAPAQQPGPS